ncbi:3-ketoacyl-CoA synthase 11-like [Tripterygium wilfordii]|uniref:3-ketoacyl-CoA synthase 11-like n=1 Tax=Tripterygium wilfordii TaxID=458696 RepID=UPI0018F7E71F|nr:3-ketoacyl-CoA synthase 11-like [Tripterygium wilfordii]
MAANGHKQNPQMKITMDQVPSVRLKYVKLGYHYLVTNVIYLVLVPLVSIILTALSMLTLQDINQLWNLIGFYFTSVIIWSLTTIFLAILYFMSRPRKVYLVNFACYKPEPAHKCSRQQFMEIAKNSGKFSEESLVFKKKILERSGYGEATYGPKGLLRIPMDQSMSESRKETAMVMFGAIDELLAKTCVKVRDIGILVVNCSLFNPTPSLSAMVVNHYKLRGNIMSYNLGGMGCSAGIISIQLAKDLLQLYPNSYALVVSTENLTRNFYLGNNRSMLVTNCLFRVGAAAILLSNRSSDRRRSKYQLNRVVRTHKGADDNSYNCIFQEEDEAQIVGTKLSKDLLAVAGEALKTNISTLGPLVLPMSEQLLFFATLVANKVFKMKLKPYIPDFKLAFEKNLRLTEWHMEPSRMTLYRFGNTSSSSLWYELAYSEAKGRIRKGDRIWQIGFGSGFKCNSAVWKALKTIDPAKEKNPWVDEIDEFPVSVPKVSPINVS